MTRRVTPRRRPRPDEGFAMSSPLALMSAAVVVMSAVAFFATGGAADQADRAVLTGAGAAGVEPQVTIVATKVKPAVKRDTVYVDVYNNSNITGLAKRTADRIGSAGWQVVGSDNWFGTIPATTVYYPTRLREAARMLARDLGIERVLPAIEPMNGDRLTVILTADFV